MKEKHIVKMFESIPKFETYSHLYSNLEKVFRANSLKYLIETLKHDKEKTNISLMDEISNVNSNEPMDIYANGEPEFQKIHDDDDSDIFDENYVKGVPSNKDEKSKLELWRLHTLEMRRKKLTPILNPFKYHPNYNSIYKNIPSFKMIAPKKILLNRDEKSNKKSKEKDKRKEKEKEKTLITEPIINKNNNLIKTPNKKIKVLNTIGNSSDNAITKAKLKLPTLAKVVNYKKIDSINIENSNHALRFSKYIPRKFVIPENNKNISYLNPINYIKPKNKIKSIDFGKMLYRGENNLINTSELKNPSFGQYNPNYACIDKNEQVKLFNPEEKNSYSHKKYLMRKLWGSYKVNTEYQLVDNDKI